MIPTAPTPPAAGTSWPLSPLSRAAVLRREVAWLAANHVPAIDPDEYASYDCPCAACVADVAAEVARDLREGAR